MSGSKAIGLNWSNSKIEWLISWMKHKSQIHLHWRSLSALENEIWPFESKTVIETALDKAQMAIRFQILRLTNLGLTIPKDKKILRESKRKSLHFKQKSRNRKKLSLKSLLIPLKMISRNNKNSKRHIRRPNCWKSSEMR